MDKDLARAMVLERCACYDRALDSAKKVLEKYDRDSDESFWALKIIRSLAEEFLKQRFADKAMECYRLTVDYAPEEAPCAEDKTVAPFDELGPLTVEVKARISKEVHEMVHVIHELHENKNKSEADLFREGLYLLILKYASDKTVRESLFSKLEQMMKD
jgi:tetratricopeptide (TPR) repeat protein